MRIFVTGTAGFIGFHLARLLLAEGHQVAGFDGMTDYYDVRLKERRHAMLRENSAFSATLAMLEDDAALSSAVAGFAPDVIVHLAAQAGVRYSLENPRAYIDANVVGTFNVMEAARVAQVRHLLMASTSSVYGANEVMPFSERHKADTPLTIYAATKKANEAMGHAWAHIAPNASTPATSSTACPISARSHPGPPPRWPKRSTGFMPASSPQAPTRPRASALPKPPR